MISVFAMSSWHGWPDAKEYLPGTGLTTRSCYCFAKMFSTLPWIPADAPPVVPLCLCADTDRLGENENVVGGKKDLFIKIDL